MPKVNITAELTRHFFRRFFENDTVDSDGDASTTVARAAAIVAAPGLMLAFFLQNSYPERSTWGRIEDQYFFVLYSFVVMAGVSIFEWELLFPERLDFLVLAPLPLRPRQLLAAKASALGAFLAMFLIASNLPGTFMLPAVSRMAFWRMLWAHGVAVTVAGLFGASSVIAVGALLLCVLPPASFRRVLWILQVLAAAALCVLVVAYARFGDQMATVLENPGKLARCVPTLWFLGVYQRLLHGATAQGFALPAAQHAWLAIGVTMSTAILLYPLAWVRMQRLALQGDSTHSYAPWAWWAGLQARMASKPTEYAIFSFIGKTMRRSGRYQVYLAIYCGVGLALAASCSVSVLVQAPESRFGVSEFGLHAVLPLSLFWLVAGLHNTFAVPQNLPARWLFRVTGVDSEACVRATRRWVMGIEMVLIAVATSICSGCGWGSRALLVQAVWNICFAVVLVESFFAAQRGTPFTRPRAPGKTSLPAVLTLYVGVLPPLLFSIAWLEVQTELHLTRLLAPVLLSSCALLTLRWIRARLLWIGEDTDVPEGEIQLLGLSAQTRA